MLLELWSFAFLAILMLLYCALHKFRIMYANVLKFHIHVWIPHEKIGDPYFFSSKLSPILELPYSVLQTPVFLISAQKHRLLVLIRTASLNGF